MKSDIEIANESRLEKINSIAKKINISEENVLPYGHYMAKIPYSLIDEQEIAKNNLILVTAITPTKAGIGKTTVSIGLALGLNKIGKKAIVALREPSLGPCFGMKGGAAGGGYAQVLPMENINLHFTGDFHAVTIANNMIAALFDNYIHQTKGQCNGVIEEVWKRVLDVNDRSLRNIVTGLGGSANGVVNETGFDITAASEIMAILCLSTGDEDLKRRIGNILLGYRYSGDPLLVKDLEIAGSIAALLKDTINPNLVQTTENTPAFIHGGPFANIAHGCNSILATKLALTKSEYVVTEAGFGADLGAEKFINIKCRKGNIAPKLSVLVVTTQALKMHGGVAISDIKKKNLEGIKHGFENLDKHIYNLKNFGQRIVVAFNKYDFDDPEEIQLIQEHCAKQDVGFAINNAFTEGGAGAVALAEKVVEFVENKPSEKLKFTYQDNELVTSKVEKIAKSIYGAKNVIFAKKALDKLARIEKIGASNYPVCIAKTQYSFSDNEKLYGVAKDFEITINDFIINNGAEFIVAIAGSIMRMPGLPKEPQAKYIDIVNGKITGLS